MKLVIFGLTVSSSWGNGWRQRDPRDEYICTMVNAYLEDGRRATAVRAGESYVDAGTLNGYREAIQLLDVRRCGNTTLREPT